MARPTYITFDCYGTLVDFDLTQATLGVLGDRIHDINTEAFFTDFAELRYLAVLGDYVPYRDVLRNSLAEVMRRYGLAYQPGDGAALIAAVPTFGPFPDVPPVLRQLSEHCRLVIISNTEDDLISENVRRIGVPFHRVITAEQARAYKPSHAVFEHTLRDLDCAPGDILHVAQGFLYDVVPTQELGWKCVWINRHAQAGDGFHRPWRELPDLTGLPALLEIG